MTLKPQVLLFTTYIFVIGVVLCLLLAPSPSAMWIRLDSLGYSMSQIRGAQSFTVPYRNDIGGIEQPVPSWRIVISSDGAERRLDALARASNPITQLYALAGLELRDSVAAASLQQTLSHDSTRITVRLTCGEHQTSARVRDLSAVIGTVQFARILRDDAGVCP